MALLKRFGRSLDFHFSVDTGSVFQIGPPKREKLVAEGAAATS